MFFSYGNYRRLTHIDSPEEQKVIQGIGFFNFYMLQSRYIVCIELCKIFDHSKNQKWNFIKLFNRIQNEGIDGSLLKTILINGQMRDSGDTVYENTIGSVKELKNSAQELKQIIESQEEIVRKVKTLRDTVYAHFDEKSDIIVSNEELNILVDLASEVFNRFFGSLDNVSTNFEGEFIIGVDLPLGVCVERDKYRDYHWDLVGKLGSEGFEEIQRLLKAGPNLN